MKVIEDFIPGGCNCDTHHLFEDPPTSITIHWIGPYPGQTPYDVRNWWISSGGQASAHYIIKDDLVLQCWPLEKTAWHAGCKVGNDTSIGIEVCPKNVEGEFSDKSIETLKKLIDSLPKLPLVRHYDWTKKDCPKFYTVRDRWIGLLKQLGRE